MRVGGLLTVFTCLLGCAMVEGARIGKSRLKKGTTIQGRNRAVPEWEKGLKTRPTRDAGKKITEKSGPNTGTENHMQQKTQKHRMRANKTGKSRQDNTNYFIDGFDDFEFEDEANDYEFYEYQDQWRQDDSFEPDLDEANEQQHHRALQKSGRPDWEMAQAEAVEEDETTVEPERRNFLLETLQLDYEDGNYTRPRGVSPLARNRRQAGVREQEAPTTYNTEFMEALRRFLSSLLQKPATAIPDISHKWLPKVGERAYRVDKLVPKWDAVECSTLDLRLRKVAAIYEGHRNQVVKLQDRTTQRLYAYKTYGSDDEFRAELDMLMWLEHPLFIKAVCHSREQDSGKLGILFNYIDGMSSMSYARTATPEQLKSVSAQLLVALEHLHWLGIVHADMKPENVLVLADGTLQVIDFGFAMHLPQSRRRRGTHTTMAPELHYLVPGRVHEGIDWWAYGSTVAMWYGISEHYRSGEPGRYVAMDWRDYQYVPGMVPSKFPADLRSFLQIFFQAHPESRKINNLRLLKQLRDHPFFVGVDWAAIS